MLRSFLNLFKVSERAPTPNIPSSAVPTSSSNEDPSPLVKNNTNNQRKNNMLAAAYGNSNENARLRPMYNKFRNNLAQKTSTTRNSINLTFNKYKNLRNTRGLKKFWNNAQAAKGDEVYGEVYNAKKVQNNSLPNGRNRAYSMSSEFNEANAQPTETLRVSGGRRTSKRSTKRRRNGRSSRTRR